MHRFIVAILAVSLSACSPEAGPAGPPGESGAGLVAWVFCDAQATVGGASFWVEHSRHEFSDGSVMATCSVHDDAREYGNTSLYREGQPGALDSECRLTYDVDAPSGGLWTFRHGEGGTASTATYRDASSDSHATSVALTCVRY